MLKSVLSDIFRGYRRQQEGERAKAHLPAVVCEAAPQASNVIGAAWHVFGQHADLQKPFDVAVIMPTVCRRTVMDAVASVFSQSTSVRIQLLIGIDVVQGDLGGLRALLERSPQHVTTCLFYPGYSTSVRHGGLHPARDGGVLRSTLTYLANARYVAYLDDDNWWHEDHLRLMLEAVQGKDWAFSLRWFVHGDSRKPVCEDKWESVGPGEGVFKEKFGGWVDPNCLMFDKLACEPVIRWWSIPLSGDGNGMSADRQVYGFLQGLSAPGRTNVPTVYYALQADDGMHPLRLELIGTAYEESGKQPAATILEPPSLSLITTCKGRLHHLRQTLPRMASIPGAEVVVVDYGCPHGTAEWVREHYPRVKVVKVNDDSGFCVARARNLGANAATASWLLFIDADILIDSLMADWIKGHANPSAFYLPSARNLQAFGTVLCTRVAFRSIEGFDEAFRGWGGEDWDLYFRLRRAGYAEEKYPQEFVVPIEHGNDERTRFYEQKDMAAHHLISQMYFYMKWDLEAHRNDSLAFGERQQLMDQATAFAARFIQTGRGTTNVPLGENSQATRYTDWVIERELVYNAQLGRRKL